MDITLPDGSPATVLAPAGPPTGGVLILHGGSADGRRFFLDEAATFAEHGLLVVLPTHHGPPRHGDIALTSAVIQRAVDTCRHALDVLGDHATGFFGHSSGAFVGALLAAADPRPDRFVLAGYGSGSLVRITARETDDAAYLAALDRFDPRHHLGGHGSRVFVQHGRQDQTITGAEARALLAAAGPGARWAEYDCGHAIDAPAARLDRLDYLT